MWNIHHFITPCNNFLGETTRAIPVILSVTTFRVREQNISDHWSCKVCWSNWYNAGIIRLRICKNVLSKINLVDHIYGLFLYTEQFIFFMGTKRTNAFCSTYPVRNFLVADFKMTFREKLVKNFNSSSFIQRILLNKFFKKYCKIHILSIVLLPLIV